MSKLCWSRFRDDRFLNTCLKEAGHTDDHVDDRTPQYAPVTWKQGRGWFDDYTGEPIKYDPDRAAAVPSPPPEPKPDVEEKADLLAGCFYCRAGQHERCAFPPQFCPCKRAGHGAKP